VTIPLKSYAFGRGTARILRCLEEFTMRPGSWVSICIGLLLLTVSGCPIGAAHLVSVDVGVQELDYQRVMSVASRTKGDWWAVANVSTWDRPGDEVRPLQVFRSADAGRSWREDPELSAALGRVVSGDSPNLDLFVWYTPDVGVIAGYMGARVLRTVDAGRTWESVPLPEELWVYDLARAGGRTWLCGSSGSIYRSDDAGASWRALRGTPFNDDDRCMSMSFLDTERGWALGMNGTLWETEDGGERWRQLTAPLPPEVDEVYGPTRERLEQVVRLTPEVGWIAGSASRFQTTDGGKTWHARPLPPEQQHAGLGLATTPTGQHVITLGTAGAEPRTWVPALNEDAVALGQDAVVTLEGSRLRTHVLGQLLWAGPLRSAGTGVLSPLQGLALKSDEEWLGWTGEHVVATFDAGRSWLTVGRVPQGPVQTLVLLKSGTALARTATGTLLRSPPYDLGRTWEPTTDALDAYDFAMNAGPAPGEARVSSPFECLLSTAPASLNVQFAHRGCFHSINNTLSLELSQDGARLSGELESLWQTRDRVLVEPRELSRVEGERIVRELAEVATREELPFDCGSTNSYHVVIKWSCPSSPMKGGKLEVEASDCSLPERMSVRLPENYKRAPHVHKVAERTLLNASH
jgi:photosystem II stability/assembly factor-like uncharacterized protein